MRFPEIVEPARSAYHEIRTVEAELDRREAGGCDTSCPRQILRELRWRLEYTADTSAYPGIKEAGLKTFHGHLKQIDGMLAGREWLSDRYSVLDPYAFVFYAWGVRRELPMGELKNYTAFKDRMLARPAVQRVVEQEKVKV